MITGSLAVIPARIGSSRLKRKPLQPLAGRPLIEWVWRRAAGAGLFDRVVIATDSDEVVEAARAFGGAVELTDPEHPSGTDRVAEIAARSEYAEHPLVVNVQGDEPFVRTEDLALAARLVQDGFDVGTAATPIRSAGDLHDPAVVKVVRRDDGIALYFSRAPIPHARDVPPGLEDVSSGTYLRHLGIYAYSREALLRWVGLPEHPLERVERLEQLRALAAGMRIGVGLVPEAARGIDTPEDLARAHELLLETSAPEL